MSDRVEDSERRKLVAFCIRKLREALDAGDLEGAQVWLGRAREQSPQRDRPPDVGR